MKAYLRAAAAETPPVSSIRIGGTEWSLRGSVSIIELDGGTGMAFQPPPTIVVLSGSGPVTTVHEIVEAILLELGLRTEALHPVIFALSTHLVDVLRQLGVELVMELVSDLDKG